MINKNEFLKMLFTYDLETVTKFVYIAYKKEMDELELKISHYKTLIDKELLDLRIVESSSNLKLNAINDIRRDNLKKLQITYDVLKDMDNTSRFINDKNSKEEYNLRMAYLKDKIEDAKDEHIENAEYSLKNHKERISRLHEDLDFTNSSLENVKREYKIMYNVLKMLKKTEETKKNMLKFDKIGD